tara:strand:+ start:383 stop:550 length:168 start_codon:yes stop_codon:yes gene_type:complete
LPGFGSQVFGLKKNQENLFSNPGNNLDIDSVSDEIFMHQKSFGLNNFFFQAELMI